MCCIEEVDIVYDFVRHLLGYWCGICVDVYEYTLHTLLCYIPWNSLNC
jgi:hypothetical protein